MFTSIDEIKEANRKRGHFFFTPATMRFFESRIGREVYGGCYFITSERGPDRKRRYTIRKALDDGSIETVSEFQEFATSAQARVRASCILEEGYNER